MAKIVKTKHSLFIKISFFFVKIETLCNFANMKTNSSSHRELLCLSEFSERYQIESVFGSVAAYMSSDQGMTGAFSQDKWGISFYTILLVKIGDITYRQDSSNYPLQPGDLAIVAPYNGVRVENYSESFGFSSLLLDTDYFDTFHLQSESKDLTDIFTKKNPGLRIYHLGPSRGADFDELLTQVNKAMRFPHIYKEEIVKSLIHVCMMYIEGLSYDSPIETRDYRHKQELFKIFLHLAQGNYKKEHQLKYYADRMNITTTYLSRAVKEVSCSTALEHLACLLFNEACKQLRNSRKTIGEISLDLGFNDQSAFTGFFKQRSGKTPISYRNEQHKK